MAREEERCWPSYSIARQAAFHHYKPGAPSMLIFSSFTAHLCSLSICELFPQLQYEFEIYFLWQFLSPTKHGLVEVAWRQQRGKNSMASSVYCLRNKYLIISDSPHQLSIDSPSNQKAVRCDDFQIYQTRQEILMLSDTSILSDPVCKVSCTCLQQHVQTM